MESPFKNTVLKGKVALITGGGSGIGLEISTQLGKHGAAVALMGRRKHVVESAAAALQSQGIQAIGFEGDVRNKEDAARIVELTVKQFGRLDILVNDAAGNFLVAAEDLSPNGFRTVLDIDSVGTFTMCHAAVQYLKKGGPGKAPSEAGVILNISATLYITAAWYQIHVSAAKAAVDSITRSLALEWGTDYEIRVNSIAPGPIEDTPGILKLAPKELQESAQSLVPLYRMGKKWDIAMAAIYLASDADDIIITASSQELVQNLKNQLLQNFEMLNLGLMHYFLNLQVLQFESVDATQYRRLVGSLIYLTHTRPDISYAIGLCSQFMQQPHESHWNAAKKIIR